MRNSIQYKISIETYIHAYLLYLQNIFYHYALIIIMWLVYVWACMHSCLDAYIKSSFSHLISFFSSFAYIFFEITKGKRGKRKKLCLKWVVMESYVFGCFSCWRHRPYHYYRRCFGTLPRCESYELRERESSY